MTAKRLMEERHAFKSSGSNGKTVLTDELNRVLGDRAVHAERPADEAPCPHQQRRREEWLVAAKAH